MICKTWATSWGNSENLRPRGSKSEAYEWVSVKASEFHCGAILPSEIIKIWSDEGAGRGWEVHEEVNLQEVPE